MINYNAGFYLPGLFVLDGPDACGKTTLAHEILSKVPEERRSYIHLTYFKNHREMFRTQYLELWRASYLISRGHTVVIDRHWMSDNVYASVYRGGTGLLGETRMMDRIMRRLCAVQVLCAPPPDEAVRFHREMVVSGREEMYEVDERILQIAQLYRGLYYGSYTVSAQLPKDPTYVHQLIRLGRFFDREDTMLYDRTVDGDDLGKVVHKAYKILGQRIGTQAESMLDHSRHNGLGHLREADIVFVGEELNAKKNGRWPLVDYGASSGFLSCALHSLEFDEIRGLWTNALSDDDQLESWLTAKPNLKVIAFGRKAEKELCSRGIQHHVVSHPSFLRRFNKLPVLLEQLSQLI